MLLNKGRNIEEFVKFFLDKRSSWKDVQEVVREI